MDGFAEIQRSLAPALAANRPGSGIDHVVVALPSYSVGESLLSHYVDRIPALEHRYLVSQLVLDRIADCHTIFVASREPGADVLDYYASLGRHDSADIRRRFHVLQVPDSGGRSVAAKLLDRPDLLEHVRHLVAGRPALIEPWNVTDAEVAVAVALGIPINGTDPRLRTLGFKSEGRRLFRQAGVPLPVGVEDVTTVAGIRDAISVIRSHRPGVRGVIVKLDDSGAGDGNVVIDLTNPGWVADVDGLPDWYLRDLAAGGVVEEMITGDLFTSPSAQIDIGPDGDVHVLATHEQVLGGANAQVYLGCRFPASPDYAAELATHARAVGAVLADRGVVGRAAVDFAAVRDPSGRWSVYALEINLRKGGTTHPYTTLRSLVPGAYDAAAGRWITDRGDERCYSATDNLVDPTWRVLDPAQAIAAVADAGLQFDSARATGVVLHMLDGLGIDGRIGLTAIGRDVVEAAELERATGHALTAAALARSAEADLSG